VSEYAVPFVAASPDDGVVRLSAEVVVTLKVTVVSIGENSVMETLFPSPLSSQCAFESPKFTVMKLPELFGSPVGSK
jgi:hypothetical protein